MIFFRGRLSDLAVTQEFIMARRYDQNWFQDVVQNGSSMEAKLRKITRLMPAKERCK